MLTGAAYRIVEKAISIRVERGEDIEEVVRHYTKLSEEQMDSLIAKYTSAEADKLGVEGADN